MEKIGRRPEDDKMKLVNELEDRCLSKLISLELFTFSWSNGVYMFSILGLMFLLGYEMRSQFVSLVLVLQWILGLGLGFLFIPIHELLHGFYFRWLGCDSIGYIFDLKKIEFSTFAHHFVLSRFEYISLLVFPFVMVLVGGTFLYFLLEEWRVLILSMLLFHTSICAGDFALISYVNKIKKGQLRIYYDGTEKKTFFTINN